MHGILMHFQRMNGSVDKKLEINHLVSDDKQKSRKQNLIQNNSVLQRSFVDFRPKAHLRLHLRLISSLQHCNFWVKIIERCNKVKEQQELLCSKNELTNRVHISRTAHPSLKIQRNEKFQISGKRRMRSPTNSFLVNLSIADIGMAVLNCLPGFLFMRDNQANNRIYSFILLKTRLKRMVF